MRTVLNLADLERLTRLPREGERGTFLTHVRIPKERLGTAFDAEIVYRSKVDTWTAHKFLPIFVPPDLPAIANLGGHEGRVALSSLFETVRQVGEQNCSILLLHVRRPIYYLPWPDDGTETELSENWQLELPGGVAKPGEAGVDTAIRELMEEAGIGAETVLRFAPALPTLIANDSGTHAERYGLWLGLVVGHPHPPVGKEGIVGHELVPISEFAASVAKRAEEGICPEVWVPYGAAIVQAGLAAR